MEVFKSYAGNPRAALKQDARSNQSAALPQHIRCSLRLKAAEHPLRRLAVHSIEVLSRKNQPLARKLRVGHSAVFITCVRLDARCLTTGSSHSLRSFGTAFRGPLTKRYKAKESLRCT